MTMKINTYDAEKITVTYDRQRCIHAAECVRGLPEVFNTSERPWVKPDGASADEIAEVVMQCPTGALHFDRKDGGPAEPLPAENTITVQVNGPLYVRGDIEIINDLGNTLLKDTRVALCRCGASRNKPFCDNSHHDIHFQDASELGTTRKIADETHPNGTALVIRPKPNGSLFSQGVVHLFDVTKKNELRVFDVSFCRCGDSKNKPFCDGSHKTIDFRTE